MPFDIQISRLPHHNIKPINHSSPHIFVSISSQFSSCLCIVSIVALSCICVSMYLLYIYRYWMVYLWDLVRSACQRCHTQDLLSSSHPYNAVWHSLCSLSAMIPVCSGIEYSVQGFSSYGFNNLLRWLHPSGCTYFATRISIWIENEERRLLHYLASVR